MTGTYLISNGIFGPTTNLLDGRSFTAVLRYDTSLGTHYTHPTEDQLFGGPAIFPTLVSRWWSASLSISSGAPVFIDGSYSSNVQNERVISKIVWRPMLEVISYYLSFLFYRKCHFHVRPSPLAGQLLTFSPAILFLGFFDMHDQFNNIIAVGDLFRSICRLGLTGGFL